MSANLKYFVFQLNIAEEYSYYVQLYYTYSQAMELVANFKHSTGPTKFVLPLKDSELGSRQYIITREMLSIVGERKRTRACVVLKYSMP